MTSSPLERYQTIRTTITAIADASETLMDHLIARGNGASAPRVAQMVAHTAVALTQKTLEQGEPGSASAGSKLSGDSNSDGVAPSSEEIACQVGCGWCCYLHVPVSQPEVQTILHYLRHHVSSEDQRRLQGRMEKTAHRLQTVKSCDRLSRKIPCAFLNLNNNRCSIYAVRPAACRDHHSTRVCACEASFKEGRWTAPSYSRHDLVANSATMAIAQASTSLGFDGTFEELHAAILMALSPETELDPWDVPDELHDAMLPTVLLEEEESAIADDGSFTGPTMREKALSSPTIIPTGHQGAGGQEPRDHGAESQGADLQEPESMIREFASELSYSLTSEINPGINIASTEAMVEWGGAELEESDSASLFVNPISAYFADGSGDALSGGMEDDETASKELGHYTEIEQELDDVELENLIQEMAAEVAQETRSRCSGQESSAAATANNTPVRSSDALPQEDGDLGFWRG